MRDPRYDILFEPLPIGPKIARNRFYQVPHCNGMGHREPHALAAMRGMKAEGGWAVVCTEEVEIHPASEVSPSIEGRLWSDADIPAHAQVVAAIHAHGALAGVELVFNGPRTNLVSRLPAMGASSQPVAAEWLEPTWCRAMDRSDIANVRRWHANAARRARAAGYDLVYVYAGHALALAQHFLSRATNTRTDEYGGPIENRVRFLRELIDATREAIGADCALPLRLAVEEDHLAAGLTHAEIVEVVGLLDPYVDLWDFCMGSWSSDSQTARHSDEGYQQDFVRGLKAAATKPVVGVGRYTSPDAMVAQIRSGAMDFVGAARPSIADPFLPAKIAAGRIEDIRECIGCNICVASDMQSVPIRCTQNPSMGEEWRRAWHPESMKPRGSDSRVLIVGAGPAGLEAAMSLGRRGYEVALADTSRLLGGRARREATLPGLASFRRVADYRTGQIARMANVAVFPDSAMTADDVLAFGAGHVAIATGARWRRDGAGREHPHGAPIDQRTTILTPDDILDGARPGGDVVVYDDDHGVLGGAVAEALARAGARVTLATPAPLVSFWTQVTLEQAANERRLAACGIAMLTRRTLQSTAPGSVTLRDALTGHMHTAACDALVLVTGRISDAALAADLIARRAEWAAHGLASVTPIGDAFAPAMIVHAVYAGRLFAESLDVPSDPDSVPFLRQLPAL